MTGRPSRFAILLFPLALAFAAGHPAVALGACGDGVLDELEQCDDGNTEPGDCCDPTCAFESADTVCRAAASACDLAETCTGDSGVCPDDVAKPAGTADAGCDACETCDGAGACAIGPVAGCKQPIEARRAKLVVKNRNPDDGDVIEWKWLKGEQTVPAEYGDPVTTTGYRLCVFDVSGDSPALYAQAAAPAGGVCSSKPCWKALGKTPGQKGYSYKDKEATPDGLKGLMLLPGPDGKAKVILKAKGENVGLPIPLDPVPLPLHVQLQAADGTCFEATYSSAKDNTGETLKAHSD